MRLPSPSERIERNRRRILADYRRRTGLYDGLASKLAGMGAVELTVEEGEVLRVVFLVGMQELRAAGKERGA